MEKDRAANELKRNRDRYNRILTMFCPVIRDKCRADCVCFNEARVIKTPSGLPICIWRTDYKILEAHCSHAMITGEIETRNTY